MKTWVFQMLSKAPKKRKIDDSQGNLKYIVFSRPFLTIFFSCFISFTAQIQAKKKPNAR
jgi:hypothetical protein